MAPCDIPFKTIDSHHLTDIDIFDTFMIFHLLTVTFLSTKEQKQNDEKRLNQGKKIYSSSTFQYSITPQFPNNIIFGKISLNSDN